MKKESPLLLGTLIIAASIAAIAVTYAQTSPGDFASEPDQTMAASRD
jgi:hypothetical protein